jgi:hypothetical protein
MLDRRIIECIRFNPARDISDITTVIGASARRAYGDGNTAIPTGARRARNANLLPNPRSGDGRCAKAYPGGVGAARDAAPHDRDMGSRKAQLRAGG